MSVDAISFSAHADFDQTSKFLDLLRPTNVILVHGEGNEMARLRKALERQGTAAGIEWTIHTPKVAQAVDVSGLCIFYLCVTQSTLVEFPLILY